ncbi:MAG: rRNA synthase [Patescibacteria group bacterium]|jgi:23S rRNA pseudouridine2605 synthase|nr:rRNA synthase [Patescibacteria group bacterium]
MRINKYVAQCTGMSRRAADKAITWGRVKVNDQPSSVGHDVQESDVVTLDGTPIKPATTFTTIILNKPAGYVVSRDGQGSASIYELLPESMHRLKPVGRLDKASSGLLLLTDNGDLANQLTHPSYKKEKVYEIELYVPLTQDNKRKIERGVILEDGISKLKLSGKDTKWTVTMNEGRNRQIRRTFGELGLTIAKLHRVQFGDYILEGTAPGTHRKVQT